jgi:hypothetical protein
MPAASFVVSLDRGKVLYSGEPSSFKLVSALGTLPEPTEPHGNSSALERDPSLSIGNIAAPVLDEEEAIVEIKKHATQRLIEAEHQAVGAVGLKTYRSVQPVLPGSPEH